MEDYKGISLRFTQLAELRMKESKKIMSVIKKYAKAETEYTHEEMDNQTELEQYKHLDNVFKNIAEEIYPFVIEEIFEDSKVVNYRSFLLIQWFDILVKLLLEEKDKYDTIYVLTHVPTLDEVKHRKFIEELREQFDLD